MPSETLAGKHVHFKVWDEGFHPSGAIAEFSQDIASAFDDFGIEGFGDGEMPRSGGFFAVLCIHGI